MNNMPLNFRTPGPDRDENGFSRTASLLCLVLPLVTFGFVAGFESTTRNLSSSSHYVAYVALAVTGLSFLLLLTGVTMGILALLLMKPGERGGIVFRSIAGLAIAGLFAAIFVPNFVRGAQATRGDNAQALKASQAYTLRVQAVQNAYEAAAANLKAAHVLSMSNITSREILQSRRDIVEKFMKCNADLNEFTISNEENFREELTRAKVSPAAMEKVLAGFRKTAEPRQPLVTAMREEDDEMGQGLLKVLDVLDENWGRWTYDENNGHIMFEDADARAQFNSSLRKITQAAKDQAATKDQLAKVVSQTSMQ